MEKNTKSKILVISIVVPIAILAGFGVWIYNALFSYDPLVEKEIIDQFGEGFFDFDLDQALAPDDDAVIDVTNPSGSDSTGDLVPGSESNPAEPGETVETTAPPAGDNNNNEPAPQPPTPASVTMESIVAKYESKFKALEAQVLAKLDALFHAAAAEYKEQEKDGTLDKTALYSKYIQAGQKLESSADAQFYALLNELQAELADSGFSTAIISEIESDYKNAKTAKKRELLSQVPGF